jgi:hypothetical protein
VTQRRRHIKFSKCPIEPHKDERWEKLEKVDVSKPVVLIEIEFTWSGKFWLEGGFGPANESLRWSSGPSDTFSDWTIEDWRNLLMAFYNTDTVFGIVLLLKQGDYYFTTFRAYDYRKHNYYESHIGDEFWIKEVD